MRKATLRNRSEAPPRWTRPPVGPTRYMGVNVTGKTDNDGDRFVEVYRNASEPEPFPYDAKTTTRGGRIRYIVWLLPMLVVMGCLVAYMM